MATLIVVEQPLTMVKIGERALEQLNYSLIKNRAWYVVQSTENVF
jgi:hypothetical protein